MKIIAGLGNPGREYAGTRHNVGFSAITELSDHYGIAVDTKKHKGLIGKGRIEGESVILVMPQTYMNLSGECLREVLAFYKLPPEELIVLCDDISLPVGKIRIRTKGSAGGHNGLKSIISCTGSDAFQRIKIGIGEKPPRMDLADYVLSRFLKEEQPVIRESVARTREALAVLLRTGPEAAMNQFN